MEQRGVGGGDNGGYFSEFSFMSVMRLIPTDQPARLLDTHLASSISLINLQKINSKLQITYALRF